MAKGEFYDKYGNQIRSKPPKAFYQKLWFWLIIGVIIIVGIMVLYGGKDDAKEPTESEVIESEKAENEVLDDEIEMTKAVEESTYTYEDFKGTYVGFEGDPYNSPIYTALTIDDDQIVTGLPTAVGSKIHDEIIPNYESKFTKS